MEGKGCDVAVIAMDDGKENPTYPSRVGLTIDKCDPYSHVMAADFINQRGGTLCVQHEHGIFGGPDGSDLLHLLRGVQVPVVTTLHTILSSPTQGQRDTVRAIADLSSRLVVMNPIAVKLLQRAYGIDSSKVCVIEHGVHEPLSLTREEAKDQLGWIGRNILTFGLLSPGKGIEAMVRAMPEVLKFAPEARYVVVGQTHPHVKRQSGEAYRASLESLIEELGICGSVEFVDRFVDLEELLVMLHACEVYVTPYLNREQITSGTLAYAVGSGRAVVSTEYWHAQELLGDGTGLLVPPSDPAALGEAVGRLLADEGFRKGVEARATQKAQTMTWKQVGAEYTRTFGQCLREYVPSREATLARSFDGEVPNLFHLQALTDDTGILQHANYDIPNRREGYCTDDNARALSLVLELGNVYGWDPNLVRLEAVYASFLEYAYNEKCGKFRNFMDFRRHWLEDEGSEESQGRAFAALGRLARYGSNIGRKTLGESLFRQALPSIKEMRYVRSRANALIGLVDLTTEVWREEYAHLAGQLAQEILAQCRDEEGWKWPEESMTYDNGRFAEALIAYGYEFQNVKSLSQGLEILEHVTAVHTGPGGVFLPIGCHGFHPGGGPRAVFDQQPIEAMSIVLACARAFEATGRRKWIREAERAYRWFEGENAVGVPVIPPDGTGAYDGLAPDGPSLNRGAESTIAYLTSRVVYEGLIQRVAPWEAVTVC
ncbi:MAG: glycosyltransferase [Fimbriimonadaceae bacterium]|nr:glycosyltransferase [Fimbriimonadaceae bacterium]QYK56730.1 MAG: glycosyltransferase [Fimbriimonadaceae bacterium]